MKTFLNRLRIGWTMIVDHPQIWFTILVSVAIVGAFLYVASRFLSIAYEAQGELANVRIGAIQDGFAPLARELWYDPEQLRSDMQEIATINPTISLFSIAQKSEEGWQIILSTDSRYENTDIVGDDFFLNLALTDPGRSFTVETTNGTERLYRTARAITDTEGAVIGVTMTEQTLSQADRNLARSIQSGIVTLVVVLTILLVLFFRHARIIDYAVLYKKLQEVDHLKDDFISMASHELRSPLTAIRGYAELARGDLPPAQQKEALERIDISAKALDVLVADMLDVSRIEQGRMTFSFAVVDPNALSIEVVSFMQPVGSGKGLVLKAEVSGIATIHADRERFRQIIMNLVGNALKYTDKGSVTIETKVTERKWVMRVVDTGIGMSADVRSHLFEKFYRAPGENVRTRTGTGLGLWITKQLVERMGGTLSVESIEGTGSHFIVSFPIVVTSEKK
jgi:signal transduction histidine kinase